MADAFKAVREPYKHFERTSNQIPNHTFSYDIDNNKRPDGWFECGYASAIAPPVKDAGVIEIESSPVAHTYIRGPETGENKFTVYLKAPQGQTVTCWRLDPGNQGTLVNP